MYTTPYFGNSNPYLTHNATVIQPQLNNQLQQQLSNMPNMPNNNNTSAYGQPLNFNTTAQATNNQLAYKVRPVTSYEEANSAIVDFDGKPNLFTDFHNGFIYVKTINPNDGSANLQTFKLQPNQNVQAKQYVTATDLQPFFDKLTQLEQNVNQIQKEWGMTTNESTITSTKK